MQNKIFIGCSGFSQGYWKGYFYPEDLPGKDYLSYYSAHLNAVEINSTFYRKPTLKTLEKWFGQTPEDFKFFIKIPKNITHLKKMADVKEEITLFCAHISSGLKNKLAGFLFQLPPSFHKSEENLNLITESVADEFLNVIEFRHESWWQKDIQNILSEKNIIFSGVSFPNNIPDDVVINNDQFLYYRLHGVPVLFKSEYNENELKDLAEKLKKFNRTMYVFFNNTWGIAGIKNALELQNLLK